MKTGELIILWVGGLLSVTVLVQLRGPSELEIKAYGAAILVTWLVSTVRDLISIWILCGLVWLTLYKRDRSKGKPSSTGETHQEK